MATDAVAAEVMRDTAELRTGSYRASWLDHIVNWIERLPGPLWLVYLVWSGMVVTWVAVEATLSSRGLFGQDPAYFAYAVFSVYVLAAYHYLSRGARTAWDEFSEATDVDEAAGAAWRTRLSTFPARPAALIWFAAAVTYIALLAYMPSEFDLTGHQPLFVLMRVVSEAFWMVPAAWMVVWMLVRQLRYVSHLHRVVVRVDLLQPAPLHAMAKLTARSSFVLLVLQLLVFVPLPNVSPTGRMTLILFVLPFIPFAIAAFFLPLRGMHALLEAERGRRLGEVSERIDATVETLHKVVDDETGAPRDAEDSRLAQVRVDTLNKALASLLQERDFVRKLSTWPWDTTTIRAVASAVALPIVLFVVTTLLDRFVL